MSQFKAYISQQDVDFVEKWLSTVKTAINRIDVDVEWIRRWIRFIRLLIYSVVNTTHFHFQSSSQWHGRSCCQFHHWLILYIDQTDTWNSNNFDWNWCDCKNSPYPCIHNSDITTTNKNDNVCHTSVDYDEYVFCHFYAFSALM